MFSTNLLTDITKHRIAKDADALRASFAYRAISVFDDAKNALDDLASAMTRQDEDFKAYLNACENWDLVKWNFSDIAVADNLEEVRELKKLNTEGLENPAIYQIGDLYYVDVYNERWNFLESLGGVEV